MFVAYSSLYSPSHLMHKAEKFGSLKLMLTLLLLIMAAFTCFSQELSGVVTSSDGESIPFASIYIKEQTTGTTSNLEGEYCIALSNGISHVSFQALGFSKLELEINMQGSDIIKNIILQPQDYKIPEIRVYSGNEDPAYGIMRKSISLAPYFLRQIKHYKASVYLKGGFDMNKVPALFRKQLKEEGIVQGKTYVAESVNELTFDSPNKFVHKQISKRSTIPNDGEDEVLGFLNYSFYDSESELAISPLSRKAFSFYTFRYEGFFQQGEYYVNKIKVTPKRKNQKLFDGYIYIVDKLWNLHSVDVVNEQFFGKIRIQQVQEPVIGKAWLPVTHQFNVNVKTMGFNVTANYGGSVKYEEVELDLDLPVPTSLKEAYAQIEEPEETLNTPPLTKSQQKIEDLLNKDDLSNREMMKLSRLMEKENQSIDQLGKGLLLESRDSLYQIVKDTISPDSIDWNKIRPIPLSKDEIESFGIRDSLTLALSGLSADSIQYKKQASPFIRYLGKAIAGGKYYSQDSTFRIKYFGLIHTDALSFNTVDALTYHQKLAIKKLLKQGDRMDLYPEAKYTFGRQELMWKARFKMATDYIRRTMFFVEGGKWSEDFNPETGISPFINMASSLLLKDNYMKLYGHNYLWLGGQTDLANGLKFEINLKYQDIQRLENSTDYSFAYPNKSYRQNNIVAKHTNMANFNDRTSFKIESKLVYTPKYYYRIDGGIKKMIRSDYPTFTLTYKGAVDAVFNTDSRYDLLELDVKQDLEWSFMYNLNYELRAGYFFNNTSMHFSDFTHFNTSEIPISFKSWRNNFNLLNDYSYSTKRWYIEGHLSYSMPYLLVKNLPFLQNKLWNENLYFSHLTQADFKNYNEIGYGISQIYLIANLGVFVGFDDMQFERWGLSLSFNLNR